mgnify:CR=1 FL=1
MSKHNLLMTSIVSIAVNKDKHMRTENKIKIIIHPSYFLIIILNQSGNNTVFYFLFIDFVVIPFA